jgi:DNA-binding transcriptional MocR family regulator
MPADRIHFVEKTWAISGVDLHVDLPGYRVRAGLEAALREAVQAGRLAPGTRLPASRALRGVAVEGLSDYALGGHARGAGLVIGYAAPPDHAYTTALARLAAAIQGS